MYWLAAALLTIGINNFKHLHAHQSSIRQIAAIAAISSKEIMYGSSGIAFLTSQAFCDHKDYCNVLRTMNIHPLTVPTHIYVQHPTLALILCMCKDNIII